MIKVSEATAATSTLNNYKGQERSFYIPFGQLYLFDNQFVVAVWLQDDTQRHRPRVLHFSSLHNFVAGTKPEYRAEGDNIVNNAMACGQTFVLGQVGNLLDTGKRVTFGT